MISPEQKSTLTCAHFSMDVVTAARDLIGRRLVVNDRDARGAIIVETEAYAGSDEPASHAAFRPGGRAAAMYAGGGTIYVYAAYGVYPCLNIVTGRPGDASAVLIRGVWQPDAEHPTLGPGRVTKLLGVTLDDHGSTVERGRIRVSADRRELTIAMSPRIGVRRGVELPWRFIDERVEWRRR